MSNSSTPPSNKTFDMCKGFVDIGYSVNCGQQGRSAGFDTKGLYLLRVSVQWDNGVIANEEQFYLGSTRRGAQRHAADYKPVNIDTYFEGNGNQSEPGRADDTQDIADMQAAEVADAEQRGDIPPDLVSVATDGGDRGDCHARIRIWCPKHVDLGGDSASKFTVHVLTCGMPPGFGVVPAPDPRGPTTGGRGRAGGAGQLPGGTGGWVPVGVVPDRVRPIWPTTPIEPVNLDLDPFLDPENRNGKNRDPLKPADPERGRELRKETEERYGPIPPSGPRTSPVAHGFEWGSPAKGVAYLILGGNAAWSGGRLDLRACRAVMIESDNTADSIVEAVASGAQRLGARVQKAAGAVRLMGFNDGTSIAVFGLVVTGGRDGWRHFSLQWPSDAHGLTAFQWVDDENAAASELVVGSSPRWGSRNELTPVAYGRSLGAGCCKGDWCKCHGVAAAGRHEVKRLTPTAAAAPSRRRR